jgi:arabinogalactan oligomer/maltooligosaccharide transport system substrate-binding protein
MRMRRTRGRTLRAGAALSALAIVLTACGGSDSSTPTANSSGDAESESSAPAGDSTLVVWADNSANTAKAIEPLCQQWAEANGVTCTVKKFNGGGELQEALVRGNETGDVPDIYEGAHDQIGTLVDNGILAPVDISANAASFAKEAVAAMQYQGNSYGVPWAVENIAMLTNKALSPECPATLDDAVSNAKSLISAGKATEGLGIAMQIGETGDFYHWYPLFTADGGYAFARNADGSYNPDDMGVDSPGGVKAAETLQKLTDEGIFKPSVSYDIARETFGKGKSPYFITGPWQIPEQQEALGDDLMVCPIPSWAGSEYKSTPFLGVRAFFQTAKAKNPTLASTFLNDEVMTTEFMDQMFAVDPRPPAWLESYQKASTDVVIKAFGDYGADGVPMPNIPQMANVFGDAGLAEFKVASGASPPPTMQKAAAAINKANANIG